METYCALSSAMETNLGSLGLLWKLSDPSLDFQLVYEDLLSLQLVHGDSLANYWPLASL